jgi:hypothetical protein
MPRAKADPQHAHARFQQLTVATAFDKALKPLLLKPLVRTLSLGARCSAPFALEKLTFSVGSTARILAAAESGSCAQP